jgi:hypothetical protein
MSHGGPMERLGMVCGKNKVWSGAAEAVSGAMAAPAT